MNELGQPIPVMRPRLPDANRLIGYLRQIDANRIYTNHGPLAQEFEHRMANLLTLPHGGVVGASSGTSALVGAILATAGPANDDRRFALMPAFTFVATALAAEQCGYHPFFADVSPMDWLLDPEEVSRHRNLEQVGLVVPVGTFGKGVPQEPWLAFREKTGIPVVIDGAASFETLTDHPGDFLGDIPVALSLHATKSFGIGEGGAVATVRLEVAERVARALNFGFRRGCHECESSGTNGKMSEYHAAVGLAELDGWAEKRAALSLVAATYRAQFASLSLSGGLVTAPEIAASYVLFHCRTEEETRKIENVDSLQIGSRRWYQRGLHSHAHFANRRRDHLETTEALAARVLGLPSAPDLIEAEIAAVAAGIGAALADTAQGV